jgi:membrane protease YdiL (CAAX protease family)
MSDAARFFRWLWSWISPTANWRRIDEDTPREPGTAGRYDAKVLIILVTVAVSLTLQEYIGDRGFFNEHFRRVPGDRYHELKEFAWWTGWRVGGYLVLPMLVIALMPGERIRDYYVSMRGFLRKLPIYVLMFAIVFPAVWWASEQASFRHTYPFYKLANRSDFDLYAWEAMYALQFLSLEFFFRGFMLHGLRDRLGANAIFIMIVPYCMIHYGKPMPETIGAIVAGLILGTLAMRTRSIWGGVLIHVAVAWTMDSLALDYCPPPGKPCGY